MDCIKTSENLSAYHDGELNREEEENIRLHLDSCMTCRSEYAGIQDLSMMFKGAERPSAPPELTDRIHEAVRKGRLPAFSGYAVAAAAVLIFITGVSAGLSLLRQADSYSADASVREYYSFASFDPLPDESLGGVYISMMRN
ncbi:MAG: anti-sigma factor [Deferribacterales bacterium]